MCNEKSLLKAILFTHNDLDGAGCITIFELAHHHLVEPQEWRSIICSNDNIDEKVLTSWKKKYFNEDTVIYFADIVPSRGILESLVASGYKVKVFDHHKTNEWISEVLYDQKIVVKNSKGQEESGTSLIYKYFLQLSIDEPYNECGFNFSPKYNTIERLQILADYVNAIRSYDTFEFKKTNNLKAKKMSILFGLLGESSLARKFTNRVLGKDGETKLFSPCEHEFIMARMKNDALRMQNFDTGSLKFMEVNGFKCAIKFIGGDGVSFSELAYDYLLSHPEIDIFIGLNLAAGTYSFRSYKPNIDVSEFAEKYLNGGGHVRASGATIDNKVKDEMAKNLILTIDKNCKDLSYDKNHILR